MIAVISSTVYPSQQPIYDGERSASSPETRLEQTRQTIISLVDAGFSNIYLADNSVESWDTATTEALKPANVSLHNQYPYRNKGISELYLLLSVMEQLPDDEPILKISGRYILRDSIADKLGKADFAVKCYKKDGRRHSISTRCYMVRNKKVFKTFLQQTLRELYGYPTRIVGPRSLLRIVKNSFSPGRDTYPYDDPPLSIEGVAARVLSIYEYDVNEIQTLGVEGFIRGNPDELIIE